MAGCSYHPTREAVGSCVNCGKMVCAECKVILSEKIYCQLCANELFVGKNAKGSATGFVIGSVILAIVALFFFPPLFGIASIILGYLAYKRNHTAGVISMLVGLGCMIIGLILGFLVWSILGIF